MSTATYSMTKSPLTRKLFPSVSTRQPVRYITSPSGLKKQSVGTSNSVEPARGHVFKYGVPPLPVSILMSHNIPHLYNSTISSSTLILYYVVSYRKRLVRHLQPRRSALALCRPCALSAARQRCLLRSLQQRRQVRRHRVQPFGSDL